MAIDPNSMPAGYGGYAAPQQGGSDPTSGLPAVTTPMGGIGNMVKALMKGYAGNRYLGQQPQGNAPLMQDNSGLGVPNADTSQAAMGGGYGGAVFQPDPTVNAMMTPPPNPYDIPM